MPLEISSLKFDYISGPTSLAFIIPNNTIKFNLKDNLKDTNLICSPILLIGDTHNETTYNCGVLDECITKESNCTSTFSPLFFRCLDSLTNQDYPIDIYLEVGIFPRFLKDPYIFDETRFKSLFDTNDGVMTYIPRYHSSCFSTSGNSQEMCFTKNIRYHLSDIRYHPSFLKLLDNEKNFIAIANDLMKSDKNSLTLEQVYEKAEELNKDKKNSEMLDKLEHFPTFESYLFYSLYNLVDNALDRSAIHPKYLFFNKQVQKIFNKLVISPSNLIIELIDMAEFKTKSMIYKRIKESIFTEDFCVKIFKEYVEYYFRKNRIKITDEENCTNALDKVLSLHIDYNMHKIKHRIFLEKINSIEKATKHCVQELFVPIMDFYFLITSWKEQYKNSILSVYIAGNVHTQTLRSFLTTKGYYEEYFNFGHQLIPENLYNPDINNNKYIYGEKKLIRCIEIPKNIPYSIDDKLKEFFMNNKQKSKFKMLVDKSNLQCKRIKYFGKDIVQEMLNGKAYSKDKIVEAYVKHRTDNTHNINSKSFLEDLEMEFIAVPLEYKDKRLTI